TSALREARQVIAAAHELLADCTLRQLQTLSAERMHRPERPASECALTQPHSYLHTGGRADRPAPCGPKALDRAEPAAVFADHDARFGGSVLLPGAGLQELADP